MAAKVEEPDILNCLLCFNSLTIPKSLPCLHMFCETCLCHFISSAVQQFSTTEPSKIKCPVCEAGFPFPGNIDVSTFVKQLSTNERIEALIKRDNLILNGTECGPCQRRDNIKKTNVWCKECGEGLCDECREAHGKTVVNHSIVDVTEDDADNFQINMDILCMTHENKKLDKFCNYHEMPCCDICVTTQHRNCNVVTKLEDAARKSKKNNETNILIQKLEEALDVMSNDVEKRESFLQQIQVDKDEVKCKIASFRTEINNRLDELETEFDKEFEVLHGEKCMEFKTKTDEFETPRKIISNCKRLLQTIATRSSDVSIFLETKQIGRKLREQEDIMVNMSSEPPFKFRYMVKFAPELANLTSSLQSLGTAQCVEITPVQSQVGRFLDEPSKSTKPKSGDFQIEEIITFTSNKIGQDILGVELLSDGRMLCTRHGNKSLYLFDTKGNLHKELKLPGKPCDVAMINEDEAAITYYSMFLNRAGVCIVDINRMTMTQENIIQGRNYSVRGVTSHLNRLIIACCSKIIILDMKGSLITQIKTPSPDGLTRYVTSISDKLLCYTNRENRSVVCIDMNGTIIFKYKHHDLNGVRGITSDSYGVIYVAAMHTNNVHQISTEGKLIKILLCKTHGVRAPYAISFDRRNKRFLLTHSESKMSVYQMINE